MVSVVPHVQRPQIGDLVVAEVTRIGKHTAIEDRDGVTRPIYVGDRVVVVFGNRYATEQFEGYLPRRAARQCDLLSVGGVCGVVASRHVGVKAPTRLRILGALADEQGRRLSQRAFAVEPGPARKTAEVILVVGASMSAGKTTVAGALVRSLTRAGLQVAAAKVTGTAAGKDPRLYLASGAAPVLDFVDGGFPSTYMLAPDELWQLWSTLLSRLHATGPDFIVVEVADGIFQRETAMLLRNPDARAGVDHVFFAANDSLSAESGVRNLRDLGWPVRAISGVVTKGPLGMREAAEATALPCLSPDQITGGAALQLMRVPQLLAARAEAAASVARALAPRPANGTASHETVAQLMS
jgi:hypothetical protein